MKAKFPKLAVWQPAWMPIKFADPTSAFPKHEIFGLASQIQCAAVSIPSNIAEGHERESTKEFFYIYLSHKVLERN